MKALTTLTTKQLKSYLEANLNSQIADVAAEISESISPISLWKIGYTNPFKLSTYNALLVFADVAKPGKEKSIILPFNLIAAISGADSEEVTLAETAYFDAVYNLIDEDPAFGGICFEASLQDSMLYAPEERSGALGIVHIVVNLEIDTLLA